MPQKSRVRREKRAKAEGSTAELMESDLGRPTAPTRHAAKKSRHKASMEAMPDRKVSPKQPPGQGRRTVPAREAGAAAAYRRSEPGRGHVPGTAGRRKDRR